jgi:tetratricopeptide (TPR) repeat protein
MAGKTRKTGVPDNRWSRFDAEAAYADSIFRQALGDLEGCISALERAIEFDPTFAPAIISMGSVEYQRGRKDEGRKLFLSLLALPENTPELDEIIDEAGSFLIQIKEYGHGYELFRAAVEKFPGVAVFH